MAKFKRFDPKNRKANHEKHKYEYTSRDNDYIKRKAEYEEWERIYGDDDPTEDKNFQPQRTGVRL